MNFTSIPEDTGLITGLSQWVKYPGIAMSCGVGHKCGLDPALMCLWPKPATAGTILPLAWELPYAVDAALKSQNETKQNKTKQKR